MQTSLALGLAFRDVRPSDTMRHSSWFAFLCFSLMTSDTEFLFICLVASISFLFCFLSFPHPTSSHLFLFLSLSLFLLETGSSYIVLADLGLIL